MNPVFVILLGSSFAGAFAIGFFIKRYWSLVLSLLFGLAVAAFSFWLFLVSPSAQKAGLGIIALIPVAVIFLGGFNVFALTLGGIIGVIIGKKRKKENAPTSSLKT